MISKLKKIFGSKISPTEQLGPGLSSQVVIENWIADGKPFPPPHAVKQLMIKDIQDKYGYNIFIETGTYMGDMVEAQKKNFEKVFSIELGKDLYERAVKRFENDKNVSILLGDSGDVLNFLIRKIDEPAIFWLDGHYSSGITAKGAKSCPIYEELSAIFSGKVLNHILLVDDARLFIGEDDYPTLNELTKFIKNHNQNSDIYVKQDAIHIFL